MKIIAVEEHFTTPALSAAWGRLDAKEVDFAFRATQGETGALLDDFTTKRLAQMDAAGIDVQVLSPLPPGIQNLPAAEAAVMQVDVNDLLIETVARQPERFQGLAAIATAAPDAGARELERVVTTRGLNGAMIYGRTGERNADHRDFWPIYEAAEALGAPLYLHPQTPPAAVRAAYYEGFDPFRNAGLATFGIGWHYDAGIQLLRLIVGGVFDRFPDLKIITGHWGELVLFYVDRLEKFGKEAGLRRPVLDYFRQNVIVTPGGILSQRYLRWALEIVGVDNILFAADYPFEPIEPAGARRFIEEAPLSDLDREKIAFRNWERLCASIRR